MSTLRVDRRAGSVELIPALKKQAGLVVEAATLPFGDLAFEGRGPGGRSVAVGVEFKRLPDLLQCITDGRFAGHQLPGMEAAYEVSYLYVEGIYHTGEDGRLWYWDEYGWRPYPFGAWTYASVENWLQTMTVKGGLHVRKTTGRPESIESLVTLYRWWTHHDFDAHRSHMVEHLGNGLVSKRGEKLSPLARMLMAGVHGLGETKAKAIAKKFGSMGALLTPGQLDGLRDIQGIGPKLAASVEKALLG